MKTEQLPKTDSITELANFWDSHDLSDFEDQLQEVKEPVFGRASIIPLELDSGDAEALGKIARRQGIPADELIRSWIRDRIRAA